MKIFTVIAISQLLLLVTEGRSNTSAERKRVPCIYPKIEVQLTEPLEIEKTYASLCTHLVVEFSVFFPLKKELQMENDSLSNSRGLLQKFERLKAVNPDLKLMIQLPIWLLGWLQYFLDSSIETRSANFTEDAILSLKRSGFDGLDISIAGLRQKSLDDVADDICQMKPEFDKNGFIITTFLTETIGYYAYQENTSYNYTRVARCSEHVRILTDLHPSEGTVRETSLRSIKTTVDKYIKSGIPPNKIVITVPTYGNIYALEDPEDTGLGAKINFDRIPQLELGLTGKFSYHKDVFNELNNSTLGWTIRRDEETKEPYAFTKTGFWASYEDKTSMEVKANYVLEKGLGGIGISTLNEEDSEGIGGEGRFPLTRAAYDVLIGGNQTGGSMT